MKRIQSLLVVGVTFVAVGCDNYGPQRISFPAQITSMPAAAAERSLVQSEVQELVDKVGSPFLVFNGESASGSRVTIQVVDQFSPVSGSKASLIDETSVYLENALDRGRAMTNKNRIAGRATRYDNECLIEIGRFVVDYGPSLLAPVLWHEIGHCAGLGHTEESGELMSAVTYPIDHYDDPQIERFTRSLQDAIR